MMIGLGLLLLQLLTAALAVYCMTKYYDAISKQERSGYFKGFLINFTTFTLIFTFVVVVVRMWG